ncbi:protein takeout-like [Ischnura elegans]|uniref:protein takeout-like n=1 Tax=Ischnura elegans TaxID=197161 RepID=UPI001ED86ED2|nr:protein takeout-like [Ischnura elegans]
MMGIKSGFAAAAVLLLMVVLETPTTEAKNPPELLKTAPEWMRSCARTDPKLDDCLRDAFQFMFPNLARGIPEIGVKRFEPLFIPEVKISQGRAGDAFRLQGSFRNILAHGPSNATTRFMRIAFGERNHTMTFGVDIPRIRIDADYQLDGNIILLPLVGNGRANINLRNVTTSVWMIVEPIIVQSDGEDREIFRIKDIKLDFAVEGLRIHLGNLFHGNKLLGLTVNNFLNQNSKEVIAELRGSVGRSLGELFKRIMNEGFSHMPTHLWLY